MKASGLKNRAVFILLFFLSICNCFAQYSLQIRKQRKALLTPGLHDTTKAMILVNLADLLKGSSRDSAFTYCKEAITISKKRKYQRGLKVAYNIMGIIKMRINELDSALYYFTEALKINRETNDKINEASNLNGIGEVYFNKSNYPLAFDYYFKALKLSQQTGDKNQEAAIESNIGQVHYFSNEFVEAEENFKKALELNKELRDTAGIGLNEGNLGNVFFRQAEELKAEGKAEIAKNKYEKALTSLFRGMEISEAFNNRSLTNGALGNIGNVYYGMGQTDKAIDYYKKALRLDLEMKNFQGAMNHFNNIGWVLYEIKNYKESEAYTKRAIVIADSLKSNRMLFNLYENLSILYEETGRYELALTSYKKFLSMRDSVFNVENSKKALAIEMNYEMDKKEEMAREESEKQRIIRNTFIVGFGLMLVLAIVIYRGYRNKQRANEIIAMQKNQTQKQKELVEVKINEITDSIHYAKRIQNSLLPSEKYFEKKIKGLQDKNA